MKPICLAFLFALLPIPAAAETSPVDLCHQALTSGEFSQAVAWAEKAVSAGLALHGAYLCLGRAEGEGGDHAKAVAALQQADRVAASPAEHIVALTLLGNEQQRAKDYVSAISAYTQSLGYARQDNHREFQRINLNQLGDVQRAAGQNAIALDYYLQAQALAANDNERAESFANIAATQSLLGRHAEAIEFQIKAVLMEERAGDLNQYAHANIELGRICLVAKAYRDAEKWLNKFLVITVDSGSPYWEAKTRSLLAQLAAAQGQRDLAQAEFRQGRALAEKIGAQDLLQEIKAAEAGVL